MPDAAASGNPNGQFMGSVPLSGYPYTNPNAYTQYGVLPPSGATEIQGSGGHPSPGAGLISGVQAGMNIGSNLKGNYRANQQYEQQQEEARNQQRANLTRELGTQGLDPRIAAQDQAQLQRLNQPQGFAGFMHSIGDALSHLGHGALPGGAPQGSPPQGGALPPPGAQPQQPAQALADGGPVQPSTTWDLVKQAGKEIYHHFAGDPGPTGPHNVGTGVANQGAEKISGREKQINDTVDKAAGGYEWGGPVGSNATRGNVGGPRLTPPLMYSPAMGAGITPASTQGQQPPDAPTGGQYRGFEQGGAVPGPVQAQPQQAPVQPPMAMPQQTQDPSGPFNQFYQHLINGALNDQGVPQGEQAIPSATGDPSHAVGMTATNPAVKQGEPEDSPAESGKPHSLTPEWYQQMDHYAMAASNAAAAAGHDPAAVYSAMHNMTQSWLQTHMMREAASAAVAFQNGDMKNVEKSLKNMNYYLPNGQDLKIQKDSQGNLIYQNPIYPYLDKNGHPTDQAGPGAAPNMVPVDASHLSMLAQAATDPQAIGSLIQNIKVQNAKMQAEAETARGQLLRGQGILASGQGAQARGQADLARVPYQNLKDYDAGQLDLAKAATTQFALRSLGMSGKIDPAIEQQVKSVGSEVDNLLLGPATIDNSSGSLNQGKVTHDVTRAAEGADKIKAEDLGKVKAWAAQIVVGGQGNMTAQNAAQIAWAAHRASAGTHPAKDDPSGFGKAAKGGTVPNVAIDSQGLHLWTGKGWQTYPMANPNAALAASANQRMLVGILSSALGGGGSQQGALPGGQQDQTVAMDAADGGGAQNAAGGSP